MILNAKTRRTGICGSAECVLFDRAGWELAVGGYLIGSLALGHDFSILAGASVTVLPFADTSPFNRVDQVHDADDDELGRAVQEMAHLLPRGRGGNRLRPHLFQPL